MDSGNWVQASRELIEYCADPRNYLNSTNIFAFESLAYDSSTHTESGVSNIISGTFMANSSHDLTYNGASYNYASALILAAKNSGVSPYHLATRILQEQGTLGSGGSISGTESGFENLYNYYNIGAYAGGGLTAVQNGLKYAAASNAATLRPWSTRMTALLGGALFIGNGYISIGQNTIYFEKFDVQSGNYYHQYMSNIYAALSESVTASKAYSESFKQNTALTFYIPVYNNMPSSACAQPTGDGNPNNLLADISVGGSTLTPTFNKYTYEYSVIVGSGVSSITVGAEAISASASVSGTGSYNLR
jgi:beta-N-acetylglucosaminidase